MSQIVSISASTNYDIEIAPGLFRNLGSRAASVVKGRNACIVSDSIVAKLYLDAATVSLRNAGFSVYSFVFSAGESSKNIHTYGHLLETLAQCNFTRSDLMIALGGGVPGDLAGFAAATYMRGIPYIQVPTTLLAMVDSSVGGKTAIDLTAGKNLAGAFYPPRYVLCDPELLKSLSPHTLADGWAEIIKYAILESADLFELLETAHKAPPLAKIIETCVNIKQHYVMKDEFDTGIRQLLNLGHTVGHSIEVCSNYAISHGHAVAIGTAIISRASASLGYCSTHTSKRIERLLTQYGLPIETNLPIQQLCDAALKDKKRNSDMLTLIIPREIGSCQRLPVKTNQLIHWLSAGM